MGMALTLADLRQLQDNELIRRHDDESPNTVIGINYYLDELARREMVRQTKRMVWLTVVITVLTLANVVAAVSVAIG